MFDNNINYRQKRILQLCCFNNLWSDKYQVESHDLKSGKDIFNLPDHYGKNFDLVAAAPPCNQFTVANNRNWKDFPTLEVSIAKKCFAICQHCDKWFLETTIGKIEKFLPELSKYRIGIWQSRVTCKNHTIYSNILLLFPYQKGKKSIVETRSVTWRESWQPDFVDDLQNTINL